MISPHPGWRYQKKCPECLSWVHAKSDYDKFESIFFKMWDYRYLLLYLCPRGYWPLL